MIVIRLLFRIFSSFFDSVPRVVSYWVVLISFETSGHAMDGSVFHNFFKYPFAIACSLVNGICLGVRLTLNI